MTYSITIFTDGEPGLDPHGEAAARFVALAIQYGCSHMKATVGRAHIELDAYSDIEPVVIDTIEAAEETVQAVA